MKTYTIGEIHRKQLLKNAWGEPYKHKASVTNRLKGQPYEIKKTPYGPAKYYSQSVIDKLNKW